MSRRFSKAMDALVTRMLEDELHRIEKKAKKAKKKAKEEKRG